MIRFLIRFGRPKDNGGFIAAFSYSLAVVLFAAGYWPWGIFWVLFGTFMWLIGVVPDDNER